MYFLIAFMGLICLHLSFPKAAGSQNGGVEALPFYFSSASSSILLVITYDLLLLLLLGSS